MIKIKNRIIVVNAVASIHSGALTILKNFILKAIDTEFYFLIFTGIPIDIPKESNIRIIVKSNRNRFNRLYWDNFELNKELKSLNLVPDLVFSLQNTDFKVDQLVPHVVFFHNPFMLYHKNWNIFNKNERLFWFYKVVYKFIVKNSLNRKTVLIVQSQWAKKALIEKGFLKFSIKVFKESRITELKKMANLNSGPIINLFYPATPLLYKNHKFLFDLLNYIKEYDTALFSRIKLNLTISKLDLLNLKLLKSYQNIEEAVVLNGYIDHSKVEKLYRESDFLVFPSLIETLGLPLIEASEFGINILSINLEYAKEVLSDYKNVVFLDCNDLPKWVENIKNFVPASPDRHQVATKDDFTSWGSMFEYFNKLITNYE